MISCQAFRENLRPGTADPAVLEHLRKCDACLDWAVRIDPDNFFRAIGGEEQVPPGGIDAFAAGVMSQVRMRQTEGAVTRRFLVPPRRLAAAAAVVVAIGAGALFYDRASKQPLPLAPSATTVAAATPAPLATKPIVETYQSRDATIVEMPTEGPNDPKVIMIFDNSLPANL